MEISKIRNIIIILLSIFSLLGCNNEISGIDINKILDDSINHSAVSYWYVGKKDGYHFVQERWPVSKNKIYKISENEINILINLAYTVNQSEWINLKIGDIEFISN
jgi:hypothetical protein